MLKNYLKVALRYLARYKEYTAINILGLAVGITCCILIMIFVKSEFSYDRLHTKSDRLYRVWIDEKYETEQFINTTTPLPVAAAIQSNYAEVESTARVFSFNPMITIGGNSFSENVRMVDSSFFKLFDFKLSEGSVQNSFPTTNTVILTKATAKKYFGTQEAVGKNVAIKLNEESILFTVAGIVEDPVEESSIQFNALIPFSNSKYSFGTRAHSSWFQVFTETYVLLKKGVDASALEKKFPSMVKQNLGKNYKEGTYMVHLQEMTKIHLDKTLPAGNEPISDPKYSYVLVTIGTLILVVACINFITLSIGRSYTRAMEVGVRKVLGAERKQLIGQFWGEAFFLTLISVSIGLTLSYILIQPFNQLIERNLSLRFDWSFLLFCLLMIAVIALIAGIYPAIILSGFRPAEVLKGKLKLKSNNNLFRQSLTIGQFVASIAMIICTIAIGKQMDFMKNKDLGYKREQVVIVPTNMNRNEGGKFAKLYREELLRHSAVSEVGISIFSFAETPWVELGYTDELKQYRSFQYNTVEPDFIKTMGLQMADGRKFSSDNDLDRNNSAIVNEAFVKEFKLQNPIGKKLPGPYPHEIVGVVKDFNYESLHNKIRPLILTMSADTMMKKSENVNFAASPRPRLSVKMKPGNLEANIKVLKEVWTKLIPAQEFEYQFLDETIARQYQSEQRTSTLISIAAGLSIFIACMGLFGLATLSVARRTREIGIRKILGASATSIVQMISKDFVKLVVIAAFIAFPLAWWAVQSWLQDFEFRTTVGWISYVIAAVSVLGLALGVVALQSIKAAFSNPIRSMRSE